jgi:hypothetical protein
MSTERANLTGTWHGQFTYPRYRKPVFFVGTLVESAGWIDGTTQEPGPFTGGTLYAAISGRRSGRAVTFVKKISEWAPVVRRSQLRRQTKRRRHGDKGKLADFPRLVRRFLMIRSSGTEASVTGEVSEFV